MTHFKKNPVMHNQHGFGLIEVMISMVIGLVILGALAYFFLGSRQINRTHDDVSRMQESGRNALEIMGKAIRQAGYREDADVAFPGTAITGTDGASSATDTITVQYDAQTGGETDCSGATVATGLVTYAFAVNGSRQLTCNNGTTTTPVVDNIEDMQITYGIDTTKDGTIESYKTAPTAAEFVQVAAVRVTLLVRGPTANVAANKSQTYTYNGTSVTKTDGFLRQVYTATYTVRNQSR